MTDTRPDASAFPIEIRTTRALTRERLTREHALQEVIAKARIYASARQAFPSAGYQDRIENAGWQLAEAVRQYDKTET
jgi:hypothetical protein